MQNDYDGHFELLFLAYDPLRRKQEPDILLDSQDLCLKGWDYQPSLDSCREEGHLGLQGLFYLWVGDMKELGRSTSLLEVPGIK